MRPHLEEDSLVSNLDSDSDSHFCLHMETCIALWKLGRQEFSDLLGCLEQNDGTILLFTMKNKTQESNGLTSGERTSTEH